MKNRLEQICPKLSIYNNVYIKRSGVGLIQKILLIGSDNDIQEFIDFETKLLFESKLIMNEKPITDNKNTQSPQLYLLENDTDFIDNSANIYFFSKECKSENKNVFDITGFAIDPDEEIIKLISLDGLTIDDIKNFKKHNERISDEKIINNTILYHYEHHTDDIFYKDDFDWVNKNSTEKNNVKEVSKLETKEPEKESSNISEDKSPKEDKKSSKKIETKEDEKTNDINNDIPVPEEVNHKVPKIEFKNSKEKLSEEEKQKNKELLKSLKDDYFKVIEYISKLHSSQWITLCNKLKESVKNNTFNEQWCPIYLEISDDISSELYAMLYKLDQATRSFQDKIVHQTITLGCFSCGKDWVEDITFLKEGPHYIECPYCYAERGFEKV